MHCAFYKSASRGHVSATPPDLRRLLLPTPSTPTALVLRNAYTYALLSNRNNQFITNTIVRKYKTEAVWSESYKVKL